MSFKNKAVLVTGGSSGIGAAIAIKFAEEGAKVAIVGRSEEKLKTVATKCNNPVTIVADVGKDEDCIRIVEETVDKLGRIDVLVNCAGMFDSAAIMDDKAIDVFDKVMNTNLRSTVRLSNLAAKHLIESKGNIVNISSIAALGVTIGKGSFAYSVSKAGVDHFTRCAALDFAASGVRVNVINPGPVKTGIIQADNEAALESMRAITALKRISEPEEVADLVMFLASDKAVGITGSDFKIDNGAMVQGSLSQ